MSNEEEVLLIERWPTLLGGEPSPALHEYYEGLVLRYKTGDIYEISIDTTSPPAHVCYSYRITKADDKGLWGVLVDSSFKETTASEVA